MQFRVKDPQVKKKKSERKYKGPQVGRTLCRTH